jgi:uracil DNA glycosylase
MTKNYDWNYILKKEYNKNYFKNLLLKINEEYNNYTCYPEKKKHIILF